MAPIVLADQFICHKEYAIAYSFTTHDPIYTTEHLVVGDTGSLPRTNDFRADPAIESLHAVTSSDYDDSGTACGPITTKRRVNSCDRGHMTPNQDFSSCVDCVSESFFMSNMVPQNYRNNEIIWKFIEMRIRGYVALHPAGVYVVSGPIFLPNKARVTIGLNKVWVPDYLFKIMIDAETGKTIAFSMPNADIPTKDLRNYVVPLSAIEASTGIYFGPSLDKNSIANFDEWIAQTK
jgi:endonuclease G